MNLANSLEKGLALLKVAAEFYSLQFVATCTLLMRTLLYDAPMVRDLITLSRGVTRGGGCYSPARDSQDEEEKVGREQSRHPPQNTLVHMYCVLARLPF